MIKINRKQFKLRLRNLVASYKIKSLWNGYRIHIYDDSLEEFFKNLEDNNNLLHIFKSAERQASVLGSYQMFFDIDKVDKSIKLATYIPNEINQTLKIDGLTEYASVGVRQVSRTKNGVVMAVRECRTANEIQIQPYLGASAKFDKIPVDVFTIKTPQAVLDKLNFGTFKLDYGVLSCKQFLNKEIIDYEVNEFLLSDTYEVRYLEDLLINTFMFMDGETDTNITRVIGQFSNQDIANINKPNQILSQLEGLERTGMIDKTSVEGFAEMIYDPEQSLLNSRGLLSTIGSGNEVVVQHSTLDMKNTAEGYNKLLEIYFLGAGLDFPLKEKKGMGSATQAQIKQEARVTHDTIATANYLRTNQIQEFIERIMIAYGIDPLEVRDKWSFQIVSNLINESQHDIENIIKMKADGLVSEEIAITRANTDLDKEALERMIKDIKEENVEKELREDELLKHNDNEDNEDKSTRSKGGE